MNNTHWSVFVVHNRFAQHIARQRNTHLKNKTGTNRLLKPLKDYHTIFLYTQTI